MCEGKIMNLICVSGNIFIEKVMFGRIEDGRVCNYI